MILEIFCGRMIINAYEGIIALILFLWVAIVVCILTKKTYDYMMKHNVKKNVAIYYNRKIIHILAGGVVSIIVPFVFKTPLLPFVLALSFALFTYIPHRTKKIMYWFQTNDNIYEVHFCFMWGIIVMLGWLVSNGNFWIGILPILFMSVGDAITGIVRNMLFKRRTKSWWGNLAMALFSIPVGSIFGIAGMLAGAVASFIEHFEFKPIDDNITVPLISFLILWFSHVYTPWLLSF